MKFKLKYLWWIPVGLTFVMTLSIIASVFVSFGFEVFKFWYPVLDYGDTGSPISGFILCLLDVIGLGVLGFYDKDDVGEKMK